MIILDSGEPEKSLPTVQQPKEAAAKSPVAREASSEIKLSKGGFSEGVLDAVLLVGILAAPPLFMLLTTLLRASFL